MHATENDLDAPLHWKTPLANIAKVLVAFSTITFFMGYFVYHHPNDWMVPGIILLTAYLVCLFGGIRYLIKILPIPVLMLLVPIAPLFVLIYVLALISFLQRFT